jgi:OmpA-OmpF porin, OOP family
MRFAKTALGALALAITGSGATLAAESPGPYLQLGAGVNFLEGVHVSNSSGTFTSDSHLNFDAGPIVTGTFGYAFGNSWRGEFEVGYRHSSAKNLTLPSGATVGGSLDLKADAAAYSYMFNAIYDFDLSGYGAQYARWSPHVGGGIGAVVVNSNRAPGASTFGAQAIAGIEYAYQPNLRFGVDYRYLGTTGVEQTFTQDGITAGRAVSANYNDHAVLLTMRWKFGGPY